MNNTKTLGVVPLIFFSIGCTIASGVFALSGDFAASGAYTCATLIGWLIAGVGMLGLMLCYFRLSIAKPELTSGIYTYAKAGFGEYIGFNAAWGYWMSAILAYVTFHVGVFGALSEVIPWLADGYAVKSFILGTIILWLLILLVIRGVNTAVIINVIIVVAKVIPILFLVIAAIFAGAFSWDTFVSNWNAADADPLGSQVISTCFVTVWVFLGIEGAVVISHRAKNTKLAGRASVISFLSIFFLYVIISVISMGVADHDTLAAYSNDYTFSMAGVMEHIVGHWGAVLVNVAATISIGFALFTYIILCVDSCAGPSENKCFPASFDKRNKYNTPTMAIVASGIIIEIFIILATFAESSYQNCYYLSTISLVIPYMLSCFYAFKLACRGELTPDGASKPLAWIVAVVGGLYGIWMFYATCIASPYVLIAALLFFPGVVFYIWRRKSAGEKLFPKTTDLVVFIILAVLFVAAIVMIATGNPMVTGILV